MQTGRENKATDKKVDAYNMWNSHQQTKQAWQGQGSASTVFSADQEGWVGYCGSHPQEEEEAKWHLLAEIVNALERK